MQLSPADLFDHLDDAPDAALVARFLADRDELAFARLVQRHGSMVLGVCRRVLGDAHAAEDAFQATFLVLVRRAGDATGRGLGPWLYGVAYRTALKARVTAFRRVAREQKAAERALPRAADAPPAADAADLAAVLDEELNRLPEPLREAVVLCDLEGLSRRQAARRAGCPESTLSSRLTLARDQLARRLTRRGIAPVVAGLAVTVPVALARATCAVAVAAAAGVVADLPVPISRLSNEVIRTMVLPRKLAAAGVVAVAALAMAGAVVVADGPGAPGAAGDPGAPAPEKAAGRAAGDKLRFVAFDGFDGRFGLNWKPVRPDESHVSLRTHPGRLTVTTQKGTIHEQTEKNNPDLAAKNIYLIDNPLAPGGDFVATTCLVGFKGTAAYQQAGLILYNDDDNYLKWVDQFNWKNEAGECFALVVETGGKRQPNFDHTEAPAGLDRVWLRLTKRGNTYDCATSADGDRFVTHSTAEWGKGGPKRVGLIAKNGGVTAPEIEVQFEFFELKAP